MATDLDLVKRYAKDLRDTYSRSHREKYVWFDVNDLEEERL